MRRKLFASFALIIFILGGCAPPARKPVLICPGKKSAAESLSLLRLRLENTVPLKANGRCLLQYYTEDKKPKKENFPVKLWVNPPVEIYMQGDVAFDPKGIVLGSNEDEFWLAMKPKEISSYWWGQWSEGPCLERLMISPEVLLEAIGIVGVSGFDPIYRIIGDITPEGGDAVVDYLDLAEFANHWLETSTSPNWNPECDMAPQPTPDEKVDFMDFAVLAEHWEENWSLSNEGVFDVLTKREGSTETRKIYINNCDYLVRRIEYFGGNGEVAVVLELDEYVDISKGVQVPKIIKVASFSGGDTEDSFEITLDSVRQKDFDEKLRKKLFTRPEPRGFEHKYRIIKGEIIEQTL